MKRIALLALATLIVGLSGCGHNDPVDSGRPTSQNEWGWTPAYTFKERNQQIARNWDWEGKQIMDDFDHAMLLRPVGHLTLWNLR